MNIKQINYHRIIFWAGLLIWAIGSHIGGWDAKPETDLEHYTDFVGGLLMVYGGFGDILRGLQITKNYDHSINAPKANRIVIEKAQVKRSGRKVEGQ